MRTYFKDAGFKHSARKEEVITEQIGLLVRQSVHVRIAKPRFMPDRLYRWLMRTIVVEEGPLSVKVDDR